MAVMLVDAGLVGSQIARILVEDGERAVLMDQSAHPPRLGYRRSRSRDARCGRLGPAD